MPSKYALLGYFHVDTYERAIITRNRKTGRYRPTIEKRAISGPPPKNGPLSVSSKMQFQLNFAGGPIVARDRMLDELLMAFLITCTLLTQRNLCLFDKAVLLLYYIVLYCTIYGVALTERYIASCERYVAIWERSVALWESNVTNVGSTQRHIKLLMICITLSETGRGKKKIILKKLCNRT